VKYVVRTVATVAAMQYAMITAIHQVLDKHSFPAREPVEDADVEEAKDLSGRRG
jgi:hypothetical protein